MGLRDAAEVGRLTGAENQPSQASIEGKRLQKSSLHRFSHVRRCLNEL
jgi:hypothetical protein